MKRTNLCFLSVFVVLASGVNISNAQTVISGRLSGYDGKPLKKSVVQFSVGGPEEKATIIEPDKTGRFRYTMQTSGLHFLNFVGVGHQQKKAVLYIKEPREINLAITLTPEHYAQDLSNAEVFGPDRKSPFNGTRFVKQADGSHAAAFLSDDSVVQYLILKATKSGEPIAGTNADDYLIQSYGGIFSVVYGLQRPENGKVKIVLAPQNLPDNFQDVTPFSDEHALDAQLTDLFNVINNRKHFVAADKISLERLTSKILQEKDPLLRQALWISYLNMLFPHPEVEVTTPPELVQAEMVSKALDELTPASPFWMLRWLYPFSLVQKSVDATGQPERYKGYAERCVENWPYQVRGWGYRDLMSQSLAKGDSNDMERLYKRLQELSPESAAAKYEKRQREREMAAKVTVGERVPNFKAHSLEDSSVVYTPDNVRAKFYLIDFWATWCGPCVREFPHLQKVYDRYNGAGLEILSYSVDSNRDVVKRFRKEKFPLAWLHAIDPQLQATESEMVKQFEVNFYPTIFLVDAASGKIVAMNEELRGEKLTELLKKLFDEK